MQIRTTTSKPKRKIKVSPNLHHAWLKLRKFYNIWKKEGKSKESANVNFQDYKQARALFQRQFRYEKELAQIRDNNIIMNADKNNKKLFFKKIKTIRSGGRHECPPTLNTPAGTYHGTDTLEGFTADAELLGKAVGEVPGYDNKFYRLCILDNFYVFDFKGDDAVKIPEMQMADLENILKKDMKLGKACDSYKLTVEHLRFAGANARMVLLKLLNNILKNIYYLTCPQIKTGLSTLVYKAKRKPLTEASSYRRITVTPQIGSIIDRYIDPIAENIFRKVQSPDQHGFTKGCHI